MNTIIKYYLLRTPLGNLIITPYPKSYVSYFNINKIESEGYLSSC